MEGTDTDSKVKETLAIGLFVEKQVMLARAAELAGKPLSDFIELLRSKKSHGWNMRRATILKKWNEEKNLKTGLAEINALTGYGIDDDAGLYFENETLLETEGNFYTFRVSRQSFSG